MKKSDDPHSNRSAASLANNLANSSANSPSPSTVGDAAAAPSSSLAATLKDQLDLGALLRLRGLRLWTTMALFSILLIYCGYHFGDRYGLLVGFFCAVSMNAMVFLYDDWRVAAHFQGFDLEGRDAYGLLRLTRGLSRRLELPMPLLRQIESDTPFIFSAGLFPSRLKLFYSTALLTRFSSTEVEAVFAHELIRFTQGQTRTATAASAFADLWLMLVGTIDAVFLLRFLFPSRIRRWCPGPLTLISLPALSLFLRLVIRRRRLLLVDQRTAEMFGNSRVLAEALAKLDSYNKALPLDLTLAEAALFPINALAAHRWSTWTSVQPDVNVRIRALVGDTPL